MSINIQLMAHAVAMGDMKAAEPLARALVRCGYGFKTGDPYYRIVDKDGRNATHKAYKGLGPVKNSIRRGGGDYCIRGMASGYVQECVPIVTRTIKLILDDGTWHEIDMDARGEGQ